jgi:multidrug efflux pump subunit AcrB
MAGINLSAFAVRERAITLFLIFAIILSGAYAFVRLGRAEDPSFVVKTLTVTAVWPGATAKEMQDLVAEPLEKRLQELRWYDRVETTTRPGVAVMLVSLKDSTPPASVQEDFYQARKKLGDESARLPAGVMGPFINDEYSDVVFAIYAIQASNLPPRELARQSEVLRQRLLHVPGVRKITIAGERPERIFVNFSQERLSTLGVSPQQVFAALQQSNGVTPAGSIETSGPRIYVRLDGSLDDLQKIRDSTVVVGGRAIKISDIATVERGYEDPPTFLIRNSGEEALLLNVVMQEGWNGLDLGKSLEAEERRIARDLPVGLRFSKVVDQAVNIRESIDEFMLKFFVALAVIMIVSLVSLGWRVGVVVAAAVPLTLAVVFAIMLVTGRVFDRITLGALVVSLGLLVDDAIIAVEMMWVKLGEGLSRVQAARYAWSHTAAPMLAGTLVTIIGFTPVGFARSTAGEYAGNIFWIVAFALIVSWLVAVVFTPYLGVMWLPNARSAKGGHPSLYETPRYRQLRRLIGLAVDHKYRVAVFTVVALLVSSAGFAFVKRQFFPNSGRPEVLVEIQMPEGSSITATSNAAQKVEQWVRRQAESRTVTTYVGQGAPRFFFSYNPELPDPAFAKIVILTDDSRARDALKLRLRQAAAEGLAPEARVRVTQLFFGPFPRYLVNFRVMGPDPDRLREIAGEVQSIMRQNPHTRQTNQDWGERVPSVHVVLDQDRLRLMGLDPVTAGQQLQFLLTGIAVTQVREDIRTVDVVVRAAGLHRLDPGRLEHLALTNRSGNSVPVSQIGRIEADAEDPILRRRDRTQTITVQCDIDDGVQPPEVSLQLLKALAPLVARLPEGYGIEAGGNIEDSDKANSALLPVVPVMVLLTLLVLVIQTRSLSAAAMVFLTAPLGVVGAVPALLLFNQPFGFNAILGLIGLSGILMRNTLILVGQIRTNEATGMSRYDAIVEATVQRARPVLLTALAAVLAFIPLTVSVFWGSMAVTLIGGTAAGTLLTLLFLPALYAIWERVQRA